MSDRPDIVWIYCDELRADALGCYGHRELDIRTPNLDALAESGVRYANSFCNSPICVSSRICTLTGLYCEDTGCYSNEGSWPNFRLPRPLDTMPQVFYRNGWATANFGKTHYAPEMGSSENPAERVFDTVDHEGGGMGFWRDLGDDGVQMVRAPGGGMNGGVWPADKPFPPEAVTNNALAWMEQATSPYLVRLSYLQPHTPVICPEQYADMYMDQIPHDKRPQIPEGLSRYEKIIGELHGLDRMSTEAYRKTIAHYYGLVAWVDDQVGRVVDFLRERGRLEQTVIVFGADHGNPLGETGGYGKHGFMAATHRVPFILSRPGTVPSGKTDDGICEGIDLPRTLFDLAGLDAPEQFKGRSVVSDPPPEAVYATHSHGRPFSKMGPNGGRGQWFDGRGWPRRACVRTNRRRFEKNMLIDNEKPTAPEHVDAFLCDWRADPLEYTNVVDDPANAETVARLSALLDAHAEKSLDVPDECLVR